MNRLSAMACMEILKIYQAYQDHHDLERAKNDYRGFLDNVRLAGFSCVEVLGFEVQIFGVEYIAQALAEAELCAGGYVWFGDLLNTTPEGQQKVIEAGMAAARQAQLLKTDILMLAPIAPPDIGQYQQFALKSALIHNFELIAVYAQTLGLICVFEDIDDIRMPMSDPADIADVLRGAPHMNLVFDSGNALFADIPAEDYYRQLAKYTAHFHLKDMRLAKEDELAAASRSGIKMTGTTVGQGLVHVSELLEEVKRAHYTGTIVVEVVANTGESIVDCLSASRTYIEQLLAHADRP